MMLSNPRFAYCLLPLFLFVSVAYGEQEYRWPAPQLLPPPPAAVPPVLVIPQIEQAPEIDGDLSDACWKNAVTATPFLRVYEGLFSEFPTLAKLAYDETNLYVAFTCIKVDPSAHTKKEYAEVLLTPPTTTEFYKAAVSDEGKLDTSIWGGIPIPQWEGDVRYAVKKKENIWFAEYAIPYSAMKTTMPKPGDAWKANLGRRAELDYRYNVAWAVTYAWFYEPQFFGEIRFGGPKAVSAEILEISQPVPNQNNLRIKLTNRGKEAVKCVVKALQQGLGPDRVAYFRELTMLANDSSELPVNYGIPDGGPQVTTLYVINTANGKDLLRQSLPSHFPKLREPYREALEILDRIEEPCRTYLWQREDDKKELAKLREEAKRLQPIVEGGSTSLDEWQAAQDAVEGLWGRAKKLEWWLSNYKLLADRNFAIVTQTTLRKLLRNEAVLAPPAANAAVSAARGEFEAIQAVIIPRNSILKNVRLELTPLTNGQGESIPVENLDWRWVDFVRTRQPHCPVDYIGWYPDPLLPGAPKIIPAETIHQPVWLMVHVPKDIPGGDYRGMVRVVADNCEPWEFELTVHVYGFELPLRPALKTSLWLHQTKIADWYGWKEIPDDVRLNQYAFLLEHRINPAPIFEPYLAVEDLPFCIERGLNAVQLGFAAAAHWPMKNREIVDECYKFLKERDLMELGFIYAQDEPSPGEFPSVRDALEHVRQAYPDLRRVCTVSPPAEGLVGSVDTWIVGPNLYNYKPVADRVEAGDELWLYLSASVKRPFVNWYMDYSAVENRLITWHCWKYGATGLLYWGINEWQQNLKPWTGDPKIDEAIEQGVRWPDVPWNTWSYLNSNGEAQLVYPGPDGEFWSSIRLEIIRDAIEDYDYFALLKASCDQLASRNDEGAKALLVQSQALLDISPPLVYDLTQSTDDPQALLDRRDAVARQIERNMEIGKP